MMSNPPPVVPSIDEVFNAVDAEVILRSSDGVDFAVHRTILQLASPVLRDMLSLPQPSSATSSRTIINMIENALSLRILLSFIYPRTFCDEPGLLNMEDVNRAAALAREYDIESVRKAAENARTRLERHIDPFEVSSPDALDLDEVPPTMDDEPPTMNWAQSSGTEGGFDLPDDLNHSSDGEIMPSYAPPVRRRSAHMLRPSPHRNTTPPPETAEDPDVPMVPEDPTQHFKVGSRGRKWPLGTEEHRCHQCRHTTMRRHMFCQSGKQRRGHACGYAYCEGCLVTRYGTNYVGLTYDSMKGFECPACRGFCNCTNCTRKRGDVYHGPRTQDRGGSISKPQVRAVKKKKDPNYGPKSVIAKRKQAQLQKSSLRSAASPSSERQSQPQSSRSASSSPDPWGPEAEYHWPEGLRGEIYTPAGYKNGWLTVDKNGPLATFLRPVPLTRIDADSDEEAYGSDDEWESISGSEADVEGEESTAEGTSPPSSPQPRRYRRRIFYVGLHRLPESVVRRLWLSNSSQIMYEPYEPDYPTGGPGQYVGVPPPHANKKWGPMTHDQAAYFDCPSSDEDMDVDMDQPGPSDGQKRA